LATSKASDVAKLDIKELREYRSIFGTDAAIETLQPKRLEELDRSEMELFIRKGPLKMLQKMEQFLGIDPRLLEEMARVTNKSNYTFPMTLPEYLPQLTPLLFTSEESLVDLSSEGRRSRSHPYFETLCNLYYSHKPDVLLPFVDLVHCAYLADIGHPLPRAVPMTPLDKVLPFENSLSGSTTSPLRTNPYPNGRTYYIRALDTILGLMAPDKITPKKVDARVGLLLRAAETPRALHFLLSLGDTYWPRALDLVKAKLNNDLEHYELFHILLIHCLEDRHNASNKFNDIWKFTPAKLSTLDLLGIICTHIDKTKQGPTSDNNQSLTEDEIIKTKEKQKKKEARMLTNSLVKIKLSKSTDSAGNDTNDKSKHSILCREDDNDTFRVSVFKEQLIKMFKTEETKIQEENLIVEIPQ